MVIRNKKNIFKKIFFSQGFLSLVGLIIIISISFPFAKNAIKLCWVFARLDGLGRLKEAFVFLGIVRLGRRLARHERQYVRRGLPRALPGPLAR